MTPPELERIRASRGWREHRVEVLHGTSDGSVLVKGQRPARGAWRYRLLNAIASVLGQPLLRAAPAHGGARAQAIEVRRLRALAAAGVNVPEVLHVDPEFFVQRWLGEQRLDELLQRGGEAALGAWQRGLRCLVALHERGQVASQAFTRNFIVQGDRLALIDFEDDPLDVLTLEQAQARDWLAYLHSTAREMPPSLLAPTGPLVDPLRAELAREREPVRRLVVDSARRLAWVSRIDARDARGWRRHVSILQSAVALVLAAAEPRGPTADPCEVLHARHH